jgi:hypothetical protein
LRGFIGHPLEARDAADGVQRDVAGPNAKAPRDECVRQLVRNDGGEHRDHQQHTG